MPEKYMVSAGLLVATGYKPSYLHSELHFQRIHHSSEFAIQHFTPLITQNQIPGLPSPAKKRQGLNEQDERSVCDSAMFLSIHHSDRDPSAIYVQFSGHHYESKEMITRQELRKPDGCTSIRSSRASSRIARGRNPASFSAIHMVLYALRELPIGL